VGESFDPTFIASSFLGMVSVRLILEMTIIVIVPLFASFVLDEVTLLAPVFNPVVSISIVDNVVQVCVIPITSSVMLL
jgi:hypothetical protein